MTAAASRIATRWHEVIGLSCGDTAAAERHLAVILDAYGDATRHYHGLDHVAALLELSQVHQAALADPAAIDLAIVFHDVVYDAARRDNEEASARMASTTLSDLGCPGI